jgi:hypothetical protein
VKCSRYEEFIQFPAKFASVYLLTRKDPPFYIQPWIVAEAQIYLKEMMIIFATVLATLDCSAFNNFMCHHFPSL